MIGNIRYIMDSKLSPKMLKSKKKFAIYASKMIMSTNGTLMVSSRYLAIRISVKIIEKISNNCSTYFEVRR